MKKIFCKTNSS